MLISSNLLGKLFQGWIFNWTNVKMKKEEQFGAYCNNSVISDYILYCGGLIKINSIAYGHLSGSLNIGSMQVIQLFIILYYNRP